MGLYLIMLVLVVLGVFAAIWLNIYQKRNENVYRIRTNWIESYDDRWHDYTYAEMMRPCKLNWYGFRLTKDSDYK